MSELLKVLGEEQLEESLLTELDVAERLDVRHLVAADLGRQRGRWSRRGELYSRTSGSGPRPKGRWLSIDVLWLSIDVLWLSIGVLWLSIDVPRLSIDVPWLSIDVLWLGIDVLWLSIGASSLSCAPTCEALCLEQLLRPEAVAETVMRG